MRRRLLEPFSWILPDLYGRHLHPHVPAADLAVSSPAALANGRTYCRFDSLGLRLDRHFREES